MAIQLGDTAPDFEAQTTEGTLRFHEWLGNGWGILFSHPKDFTPVCTTELGECARLEPEFRKRNTKILALSVDSLEDHRRWSGDIEETQGARPNYPIIADPDRRIAELYGMIPQGGRHADGPLRLRHRTGQEGQAHAHVPGEHGANIVEILRVLDSLQLTAQHSVATPVNWRDGEDVIVVPSLSDEQARAKFPKGFTTIKPYLRITPQPNE